MEASVNGASTTPLRRVLEALRAEIKQLGPGARLPSQHALSEQYGVSRSTVQKALDELRDQGLITSAQGSGSFVAEGLEGVEKGLAAPLEPAIITLDPYLDAALQEPHVTIDYYGFTSETLTSLLKPRLDRLRSVGAARPDSLVIRLLLPDLTLPLMLPRGTANADDPRPRERIREMTAGFIKVLGATVADVRVRGWIGQAELQVRVLPNLPLEKRYVINRDVVLEGRYKIYKGPVQVPAPSDDGTSEDLEIYDLMGLDASLKRLHSSATAQAQEWFDSYWESDIAVDYKELD
jgi:biotin operon repressor